MVKRSTQKTIPPVLERYELKYMIPYSMIEPISTFLSSYCTLDMYSQNAPTCFYRVNSLYLDSPDWAFLKMWLFDSDNRINMRVRSYGDDPDLPYFLEIKQKRGGIVRKYRAQITNRNWYKSYIEPGYHPVEACMGTSEESNRKLFERMVYTYNAAPVILTQYERMAWISDVDDYARVTFDIDMRYRPETEYKPTPGRHDMTSCDHSLVFDPGCDVILELKCYTTMVPLWMIDMIRHFDLRRRSFSKYATGAGEMMGLYNYDSALRVSNL